MTLSRISPGARVFVDSTIFIYHFTGTSADCRRFLERCEAGDIKATTSVVVMAEVAHRLMMIEAVARGLLPRGNLARRLRTRPDVVRELDIYQQQVERIPLMGVKVLSLDVKALLHSQGIRKRYGLLVNDSLVAASATLAGLRVLATADSDFERVTELEIFGPEDLKRG